MFSLQHNLYIIYSTFTIMIDINLIRENPELVKENIKQRNKPEKISLLNNLISLDKEYRQDLQIIESLRHERNIISEKINLLKKSNKDASKEIKRAKELPEEIKNLEEKNNIRKSQLDSLLLEIPNLLNEDVPFGKDGLDNPVIKKVGKPKKLNFELKNHAELLEQLGYADFEQGISNAGKGFNYLSGDIAILDLALQRYGVEFLIKNKFTPIVPPMLLNHKTLLGALNGLKDFEDVVYKVDKEDLYLIGTAEHSLVTFYKNKMLREEDLPRKIFAVTPCFRKEIGGHGIDTKWLFRMHQFNKVEQVIFTKPEESLKILKYMQGLTESFFKSLEIPFRVIEICSGDLGNKFAKQFDIEAWFPRQNEYKEVTSAGSCTDFQARALNIKYLDRNNEKKYVHILNNTMVATSRAMVAIIENHQQKDGSIKIPKALHKYTGFKVIKSKN